MANGGADSSQGEGWWLASDGKWYPPQSAPAPPTNRPAPSQPPATSTAAPGLPAGCTSANPWLRLGSYFLEALLVTVTLGIGWLIWAATIAGNGQTPAKKLLGLRVISDSTMTPIGLGRMFWVRGMLAGFVASFAIVFTLGVLLFMPLWDKRNQNIWDKISSTYVVTDPNDAWNTRPDLR